MAGQKTINSTTPAIGAIKIQQSTYGLVLPIVWGRTRITGNLIWYGAFKAIPHTEVTQSGGKGGGAPRQTTTSYTYTASVAMALCEGPVFDICTAWRGKKIYTGASYGGAGDRANEVQSYPASGNTLTALNTSNWVDISVEMMLGADYVDEYKHYRKGMWRPLVYGVDYTAALGVYTFSSALLSPGTPVRLTYSYSTTDTGSSCLGAIGLDLHKGMPGQAPWSYLTTNFPSQALGYSSVAYVSGADYALDDGASVENHSFEVQASLRFSASIPDANPAPIVVDALSNPQYGAPFGTEKIGSMADYTAACTAQGIFLSPALTSQVSAAMFLSQMAALTNVGMVWSGGQLKFVPYADVPLTGNGVTFTPNTTPIYDLTDDDFQTDPPIKVNRGSPGDTFNRITLEIADRANAYNVGIVTAEDQSDIQENGPRPMSNIKADWITTAAVGKIVAQLILQRSMFVRNTYEFTLNCTKIGLEPMDLVTLTDPVLMTRLPVRILTVEEDDSGYLAITAEDFPKGSASATLYPSASGAGFAHDQNESPGTLDAPVIFEAPAPLAGAAGGLELWLAAGNNSATYGGCEVWVSLTGSNFQRAAVINGASRFGSTTSALAATAGTTTETVGVALTAGGQLLTATVSDMNALSTLCYLGGEFIGYETATLTSVSAYTLGNHMLRGAYLSPAVAHASGAPFVRCDEAIARMPLSPDYIGKTLHIKILPFNRYGGGLGDLASATEYTYTVTGAQANNAPIAPTGLALEGAFTIDTAKFKWNAVSNASTYNVQIYNGSTKVREVNVGNALRFDYSSADAKVDGGPWRNLTAKVQGINANGAVGPLSSLAVSNPQMGALTGVSFVSAVGGAQFSCALPTDQDFLGIQICMSTTSGFTPGPANLIYDGPSTTTTITGQASGTPLYFRAAAYDNFDKLSLTWSAEFTATPTSASISNNSITAAMLQAGIIDLTKFASGIEPLTMVTSVPSVKSTYSVFNTTDGKLYRWNGSAYVTGVVAADLSGTLADAQLASIAASKITGQLSNAQLAAIDAAKVTGQLTNAQIAALDATKLTGQLSNAQLAAIDAAKVTGQIVGTQITNGAISTAKLAVGAVTANEIAADTITAAQIAANAITASELAAGAVTTAKLVAGAVTTNELAAGSVTTAKLVAGAVTANEIAADTITAAQIAAGAITASELAAGSVTTAKLAAGAVTANEIAADTITAAQIAANAITASELAADSVTAGKVAAAAISAREIAAGAITTGKLAVISKGQAINDDPSVEDAAAWVIPSGVTITSGGSITRAVGLNYFYCPSFTGSNVVVMAARAQAINAANTYNLTANLYATPGNNREMYLIADFYDASGAHIANTGWGGTYTGYAFGGIPISDGTWNRHGTQIGAGTAKPIPSNAVSVKIGVWFQYTGSGSTSLTQAAQDIRLERVNDGTLIQDGAITTNKITAGAVTAGKINVANLAAISAELGSAVISTTGSLSSGQTAYDTGAGWWLGFVGGVPKWSIGVGGSANSLKWDGNNLLVGSSVLVAGTAAGTVVSNAAAGVGASNALNNSPVVTQLSPGPVSRVHASGNQSAGTFTASVTGGASPFKYAWAVSGGGGSAASLWVDSGASSATVSLYCKCNIAGTNQDFYVTVTVTDDNGLVGSMTFLLNLDFS